MVPFCSMGTDRVDGRERDDDSVVTTLSKSTATNAIQIVLTTSSSLSGISLKCDRTGKA